MNNPRAWLIEKCPNFYFMPPQFYDAVFTRWEDDGRKCFPEYWKSVGFQPLEMIDCQEHEATHWLVNNQYAVFDSESACAAKFLGKTVDPIRVLRTSSPMTLVK